MNINTKFIYTILYFYGLAGLFGGLIYTSAGMISPVSFSHTILYTPELASQFMQKLQPYWFYYSIAFILFVVADTALMLLGLVLRQIFGSHFHTNTAVFCFFAAGFVGVITSLTLLTSWLLIGTFNLPPEILENYWSTFLIMQYHGAVFLIWAFFLGAIGLYLIYKVSNQSKIITDNNWKKWTLSIFLLCLLAIISIIYTLITNDSTPTALVFLTFRVFAAPAWSILLANKLRLHIKKKHA